MKKILSIIFLFALLFSACDTSSYSYQLAQEKQKISQFFKDSTITIINAVSDSVFSDGVKKDSICNNITASHRYYLLGTDSIYIRINKVGIKTASVSLYDRVEIRYIEKTLDGKTTESYWTTLDLPYPPEVIFGDIPIPTSSSFGNGNCAGWQSAIAIMKYSEAEAEIIVPSKLGIARNYNSVTPCYYKFYFKLLPK